MKKCKQCGAELPPPTNPKTRNYKFCNKLCRNRFYYDQRGGAEAQREYAQRRLASDPAAIQCIICGKWYIQVGTHIWQYHHMRAREYRECFDLEVKRGLTKDWYRAEKGATALENGTFHNLENGAKYRFHKKDPLLGRYKRSPITLKRVADLGKRRYTNYKYRKTKPKMNEVL